MRTLNVEVAVPARTSTRGLPDLPAERCYFCSSTRNLAPWKLDSRRGTDTAVLACAEGYGCHDDTIRHGPPWSPHPPGAQCEYCEILAARKVGRSNGPSSRH